MRPILSSSGYLLAATLTVAVATAGCGSPKAATSPAPVTSTATVDLLTQTGAYTAGQKAITDAEGRLVARCMTAAGLRYVQSDEPSGDAVTGYGLYAIHAGKQADPRANTASNDYYLARLSDTERSAYLKVLRSPEQAALRLSDGREITYSTKGCESAARAELYGDLETQVKVFYVPQIVNTAIEKRIKQDPRYVAALATWRSCMASESAPYASTADARQQVNALYEKTGPTATTHRREIAVATLDRSCATKTQLAALEVSLVRAALAALPEPDRQELNKLAASWQKTVEAARSTP
jgi:hypothetical protein